MPVVTLFAFLVAIGLLIAVHEYGHYRAAVACGVKVLRFSLGFGPVLLRRQSGRDGTEFVLCVFPLGGYVRMLDERDAPVEASLRSQAFNAQPLRSRAMIVAAGPLANLVLAIVLYSVVNWAGFPASAPVLGSPAVGSEAERAGVVSGSRVNQMAVGDAEPIEVSSFEDVRWRLTRAALAGQDVRLYVEPRPGKEVLQYTLRLSQIDVSVVDESMMQRIGIIAPYSRALIGGVTAGTPAAKAGLQSGDIVERVGNTLIADASHLRSLIRRVDANGGGVSATWSIYRSSEHVEVAVTPEVKFESGKPVAKIGAFVGAAPETVVVRYGVIDGLWLGIVRTWDVSLLTLRMMGKMVVGEASLKNLSGPLTIADYAGKSASLGWLQYLGFLGLISVSLGVLNLLPLPVLDGGHLMYYLYEGVSGKGVSEQWLERFQRAGVAVLMVMMSIALFNDLSRFIGSF